MSFILDALKKSETERQEQRPAEFANVPSSSDAPRAPRWLWVLGLLLVVNIAVLTGLLLHDDTPAILPPGEVAAAVETTGSDGASFIRQIEQARERRPVGAAVPAQPAPPRDPPAAPQERSATEAPQTDFTLSALPTANELRANGTITMADLHLDIHVYSEEPSDRFVFINMVRHQENSRLAEGPVVREITPEGVVLDYLGTRFLLPRE